MRDDLKKKDDDEEEERRRNFCCCSRWCLALGLSLTACVTAASFVTLSVVNSMLLMMLFHEKKMKGLMHMLCAVCCVTSSMALSTSSLYLAL